ncbi:MAG: DUF2358 domain-containing protein [Xenococcaceae cyanobacterium MO_188.B32]|nr:DUF2358 domain-containing protein [Xenococcaceae cyanobacterium MO_188.B32]
MSDRAYTSQVKNNIETLRAELPHLFETDLSYDIYTKDIYFQDPISIFKSKFNYRIIFWTLRLELVEVAMFEVSSNISAHRSRA